MPRRHDIDPLIPISACPTCSSSIRLFLSIVARHYASSKIAQSR